MESVKQWLWTIALKKGLTKGIEALVALLLTTQGLDAYGITIDPETKTAVVSLVSFGTAIIEFLRNWLKHKIGVKFL